MKRHAAKRRPKHIRRIIGRLCAAGAADVRLEVGKRYLLSWTVRAVRLRIACALSEMDAAGEATWLAIRALFRTRGLPVPA